MFGTLFFSNHSIFDDGDLLLFHPFRFGSLISCDASLIALSIGWLLRDFGGLSLMVSQFGGLALGSFWFSARLLFFAFLFGPQ